MSRTRTITLTLGSLAAGAVLATGVTGLALADDQSSTPTSSASASMPAAGPMDGPHGPRDGMLGGPRGGAHEGPHGRALHGEMVVKADDGTITTVRSIHGEVTAVSGNSITVKAEDGYTATFAVTSDTEVRVGLPPRGPQPGEGSGTRPAAPPASTDTIADVTVGDVAHVEGTVSGSTATADHVMAMTADEAAQVEAAHAAGSQQPGR